MLTRWQMLTTKKRGIRGRIVHCGFLVVILTGCTPAGPRALLRGEREIKKQDYAGALEDLKEAVSLLPNNAQAWNHLGLAYHYAGQSSKAIEAYQHALLLDRNLASACFNAGCLDLETGNYSPAVDYLTTYTSFQPRFPDGWLRLASAQTHLAGQSGTAERLRLLEAARRSYEFVNHLRPSAEALNGLGLVAIYRSHGREGANYFESALQIESNYPPAVLNLAIFHDHNNERRVALAEYRAYASLKPGPANSAAVAAEARLIEQELLPITKPVVPTNLIASRPVNPIVNPPVTNNYVAPPAVSNPPPQGVGKEVVHNETKPPAQIKRREVPPPILTQTQVVALAKPASPPPIVITSNSTPITPPAVQPAPTVESPESVSPLVAPEEKRGFFSRLNPGKWFSKKKETPPREVKAEPVVQVARNETAAPTNDVAPVPKPAIPRYHYLHPNRGTAGSRAEASKQFERGMAGHKLRHYPEAIQYYERATNLDPTFFEAYYNLGLAAYEDDDMAVSLTAYEHALSLNSDFKDLRYNFALSLLKGGYVLDAADEFQDLAALMPNDSRLHLSLANIYAQKLGDPAQARQHYQKVLSLQPHHPQAAAIRSWLAGNPE